MVLNDNPPSLAAARDRDGFLLDPRDWNDAVADALAAEENIALTDAHRRILLLAREFHRRYDHSPEMRPFVAFVRRELGDDYGNSLYLLSLFPGSPAKLACKIAGLPRPANCL